MSCTSCSSGAARNASRTQATRVQTIQRRHMIPRAPGGRRSRTEQGAAANQRAAHRDTGDGRVCMLASWMRTSASAVSLSCSTFAAKLVLGSAAIRPALGSQPGPVYYCPSFETDRLVGPGTGCQLSPSQRRDTHNLGNQPNYIRDNCLCETLNILFCSFVIQIIYFVKI